MPASTPTASVPHPLDEVPQTFAPADSYDVREKLGEYISDDLLGPWDGDHEELPPHAAGGPRDRYLVGMLGPRTTTRTTEQMARVAAQHPAEEPGEDGDHTEPEPHELLTPQAAGRMWASSMGMSFLVPASVGTLSVVARWGRYQLAPPTREEGEEGEQAAAGPRVWAREPVERPKDIAVQTTGSQRLLLEGDDRNGPCVRLDVQVRRRETPADGEDLRVVELALVNDLVDDETERRDVHWLYQTQLEVTAFADPEAAVFLPLDDPLDPTRHGDSPDDAEERRLRLLYKNSLQYAKGRNVAVHAEAHDDVRRAHRLTTTWLPTYDVADTTAPSASEEPGLAGVELSMDKLAELALPDRDSREKLAEVLSPLADGYETWLEEQRTKAAAFSPELRESAEVALAQARDICHRIAFGIDTLNSDDTALEAFRFANRAMAHQRRNTAIAAARAGVEDDPGSYETARKAVEDSGDEAASWRPFQLAFFLLNVASLSRPGHPHRGTDRTALVDLLFFPTGGGKTEAYLGLAAYTFALRRLQGVVGTGAEARSGADGVGVLMRYTLRLLTSQQFQRAAALVSACEVLRRQEIAKRCAKSEQQPGCTCETCRRALRWGHTPFRVGLWVGATVSPNWFSAAKEQIGSARVSASDKHAHVSQILNCPWCGSGLTAHRNMDYDEERRRVLLYCPRGESDDPQERCPFSRRSAPGEGIPVLTVDEEIYRLTPALLVATVDKFAQLPWNGYAGLLFGRVTTWCERHGYRHDDLDQETGCRDTHKTRGQLPAVRARQVSALRPPDLIIQDELHLISGALGTTVGLFEAAVDQLCSWSFTDESDVRREVGPKIVASTATTKRAGEQVRGVFGREVAIFPPQVTDVGDTFFSRQVPTARSRPGRRYLGVCAHGNRLKAAEIRVAEILLLAGQQLFDDYGAPADPYMTLVGYFNATRELAGMRRYLDDDITTRLRSNGSRKGHRTLADRIHSRAGMLTIQELTSRISSADISKALKRLQTEFDPERHTSLRDRALLREYSASYKEKREPRVALIPDEEKPVGVVLATSMLQVGVDVSRFGLMLAVGQPKNTAEYIQATSRVGRDPRRPGLVVTLYNWSRPRDLAHYEDFEHYHATFYKRVEALSVTPFTRRSLDRGTAATYIAAVRQAAYDNSRNTDAHTVDLEGERAAAAERRLLERADAVSTDQRAREYLKEKLDVLKQKWVEKRGGSSLLGYRRMQQKDAVVSALLNRADGARWDELTVPMSMRETEHEINLLLHGGGRFLEGSESGGPAWQFGSGAENEDEDPAQVSGVDEEAHEEIEGRAEGGQR